MIRVAALILLAASPALAAPTAKQLVDAGLATFVIEHYDEASRDFEAAYALSPEPVILYSWAQSERLAGRCPRARQLYARYLAAPNLSDTQTQAARAGLQLCPISTDSALPPSTPPPSAATLPPLPPELVVDPGPRWYSNKLADGLVIGGAAALAVGVTFFAVSHNTEADARSEMFLDTFKSDLDSATLQRRVGFGGLAVGAALTIAGVVVFIGHKHPVAAASDGRSVAVSVAW
jgi:hypothetical protein